MKLQGKIVEYRNLLDQFDKNDEELFEAAASEDFARIKKLLTKKKICARKYLRSKA